MLNNQGDPEMNSPQLMVIVESEKGVVVEKPKPDDLRTVEAEERRLIKHKKAMNLDDDDEYDDEDEEALSDCSFKSSSLRSTFEREDDKAAELLEIAKKIKITKP